MGEALVYFWNPVSDLWPAVLSHHSVRSATVALTEALSSRLERQCRYVMIHPTLTVLCDYLYIFIAEMLSLMLLAWSLAIHWQFPQCLGWSVDQSEAVLAVLQWGLGHIRIHTAKIMCPYVEIRSQCILKVSWVHSHLHPTHRTSCRLEIRSVKMLMAGVNRACVLLL